MTLPAAPRPGCATNGLEGTRPVIVESPELGGSGAAAAASIAGGLGDIACRPAPTTERQLSGGLQTVPETAATACELAGIRCARLLEQGRSPPGGVKGRRGQAAPVRRVLLRGVHTVPLTFRDLRPVASGTAAGDAPRSAAVATVAGLRDTGTDLTEEWGGVAERAPGSSPRRGDSNGEAC
mmetsp:Transcript_33856/g.97350  ORF Transcript_33856/g.97350 Transcript_33856/m.97350 type:complete len:181 (+) Transcript_33856:1061-1603(+)